MSEKITLGLIQMAMGESPEENLAKASGLIDSAANQGAEIVALPELFRSPYFCVHETCPRDYAEPLPGVVGATLSEVAKRNKVTLVGGSIYERAGTEKFNTSAVFDSTGKLLGQYRKTHIPHDPGFYEQHYFGSGGENYKIFETKIREITVKVGVLICYDQWFPEAARSLALLGADIIFYPTAIATVDGIEQTEGDWSHAWKTVQCGHAVANSLVVAAINRVGKEGSSNFWGKSFICNAFGQVISEGEGTEGIVLGTIDLAHSRQVRESWRFFYERRPDTYGALIR